MSAIIITDPVKLRHAIEFAQETGCIDQLGRDLCALFQTLTVGMTMDNERIAELGPDFAPHSMSFAIFDNAAVTHTGRERSNLVMNGGWIYAGPGAPGDGSGPSFSVNLEYVTGQAPKHKWSVHT
jgi:hypothetical protein